jgi:hypothetical protein
MAGLAVMSAKNAPIDNPVPEFWKVERSPEATARSRVLGLIVPKSVQMLRAVVSTSSHTAGMPVCWLLVASGPRRLLHEHRAWVFTPPVTRRTRGIRSSRSRSVVARAGPIDDVPFFHCAPRWGSTYAGDAAKAISSTRPILWLVAMATVAGSPSGKSRSCTATCRVLASNATRA